MKNVGTRRINLNIKNKQPTKRQHVKTDAG